MRKFADCRTDFPALERTHHGRPLAFLDGPAGSQVPQQVIDAISNYYTQHNSNTHGQFITTHETDQIMNDCRTKMSDFLGAPSADNISLGQNMTTLCYSLSRAIGRTLREGDEVLITQLDHEANRGPWKSLEEWGIVVREVELLAPGVLNYEDLANKISAKTKLLAIGYASNLNGTVNDIKLARKLTQEVGALLAVDAVHYAPHYSMDVSDIDCDFLLCSAYKFYGPHVGILYTRSGLLEQLPTDHLVTADPAAPYSIETGTLNHAAFAGATAAMDYIAGFGEGNDRRAQLVDAMNRLSDHEHQLGKRLFDGLREVNDIEICGLDFSEMNRTPTVSFYTPRMTAEEMCTKLADQSICAWDGHFYAERAVERLGLLEKGGVTRLGVSIYTSEEEIDYTVDSIKRILAG